MSSENTPILAATVPAFELFVSAWETMTADPDLALEDVASIISPGLNIAKNYYRKLDDSDAYVISMCACSCWSHMCSTGKGTPPIPDKCIYIHIFKQLEFYRDQHDVSSPISRSSSPAFQGSRNSSRSRGPAVPTMLANAAKKYRNVQQALDFSSGTASDPSSWTVEQEMDSYIRSPISPPQTTDMIGYWIVRDLFHL
jgi:hypothetical protein